MALQVCHLELLPADHIDRYVVFTEFKTSALLMFNYNLPKLLDIFRYVYIVSVLGQEEGYAVKYTPLPEGVPEGEAQGNSWRRRGIFDGISWVKS